MYSICVLVSDLRFGLHIKFATNISFPDDKPPAETTAVRHKII